MPREEAPYIVEDRRMMSRICGDRIKITHTIEPGKRQTGCLACCHAPDSCPTFAYLPCFDYPQYIVNEVNASKYIYIRENGLEWNDPGIQADKGRCCGLSCTHLAVMDRVTVLYFDDIHFDNVRNDTRWCDGCLTFLCGGRGEQVQIESTFCCGCCFRGRDGITCIPACCPEILCPCMAKAELWVQDSESAVETIREARDNARVRLQVQMQR